MHVYIWQGVTKTYKWGSERQKINYEANNDRNLTKLTIHCLDLYQIEVWPFFRPHVPPIMVITAHIYWKWGGFLVRSETIAKVPQFHSQILLNDFDFWQFSIDLGYVRVYGKLRNLNIFAPFGLWNCGNEKKFVRSIFPKMRKLRKKIEEKWKNQNFERKKIKFYIL